MTLNQRPSPGNLLDGLFKDSSRTLCFRILFYVVSSTPVLVCFVYLDVNRRVFNCE